MQQPLSIHRPTALGQYGALLGCFLAGPITLVYLADALAPSADLAVALTGLLASAVLFGGLLGWLGLAVLSLLTRSGRARVRDARPPAGTTAFVWVALLCGGLAAVAIALGAQASALGAFAVTLGAFLAWGWLLHRLARAGWLPFPEDTA